MPIPRLKQSKPVTLPQNPSKIDTPITPVPAPPLSLPGDKQYKMGIGSRIVGTAANFLSGFAGRSPVVYTGPGAVSSRYNQDRQKWQTAHDDHETRLNDLKAIYDQDTPQPAHLQDAANTAKRTYKAGDTVSMGGKNHTVVETLPDGSMKIEPWPTSEEDPDRPMGPFYAPGESPR